MSLVREDSHGLYVRSGGIIFRPQLSSQSFPGCKDVHSKLLPGEKVNARHRGGTGLADVGNEIWYSHGPSEGTDKLKVTYFFHNSETVWTPVGYDTLAHHVKCKACNHYRDDKMRCSWCGEHPPGSSKPEPFIIRELAELGD